MTGLLFDGRTEGMLVFDRALTDLELDALNLAAKEYRAMRETEPFMKYVLDHAEGTLGYRLHPSAGSDSCDR